VIERGKSYRVGDLGASWQDIDCVGWLIFSLSAGNAVGTVDTADELLREFPEFVAAEEQV
jgi:hypothetical protein